MSVSAQELLREAILCFNDPARREEYLTMYAEHARLYGYAGVEPGRAGVSRFYEGIWTAFPDANVTLEHVLESGDEVAARLVLTGTHQGPLNGIPPTGLAISMPIITIIRFEHGLIAERWSQGDFLGLLMQIGAVSMPRA